MLFDSPAYFVFLVTIILLYWQLKKRAQNVFLLAASYFFYGWWDWRFLALMIGSTAVDFLIARKIAAALNGERKKWLLCSLIVNFSILAIFKYFNFFIDSFAHLLTILGIHHLPLPLIRVLLPPGISFYTFQEVAYIVEVYKGRLPPVKSFVDYALFVSLFPHLIAGPIQRPGHLLPQVQSNRLFDANRFFDGMLLILSGLLRKCVVADNCAVLANAVFGGQFGQPTCWTLLIGVYAFAWQVYGDFSGYSDIARGSAQLLGFHFMVNFRQPFLAVRFQDFWRRWHISLSTWLRDYLYIPLGGSAHGEEQTSRNLLITMVAAGLWHGANWTFVVFGAIHGVVLASERFLFGTKKARISGALPDASNGLLYLWGKRILTFNIFCLTLVFFRATSLSSAMQLLRGASSFTWHVEYASALTMLSLFAIPLFCVDLLLEAGGQEYPFANAAYAVRTAFGTLAIVALTLFSGNSFNAFIYFRF